MLDATGFLTNTHVDQSERGERGLALRDISSTRGDVRQSSSCGVHQRALVHEYTSREYCEFEDALSISSASLVQLSGRMPCPCLQPLALAAQRTPSYMLVAHTCYDSPLTAVSPSAPDVSSNKHAGELSLRRLCALHTQLLSSSAQSSARLPRDLHRNGQSGAEQ